MATKADRSEATKSLIIEVARKVFARDGYASAALAEIVTEANVTTGAVYHHFGGKKGLFIAVAEHLEQLILDEVAERAPAASSPWEAFENGLLGTLEICARPDIQRIVFRDAPNVVGLAEWREIEIKYAFGLMRNSIQALSSSGMIDAADPDLTAQILLGAIIEAAHGIALSDDPDKALRDGRSVITKIARAFKSS